uniref:EamA domain-containing protein n=1 Tax=Globisporangium ultimum (strain ATCC 200006 / CBS 805.95 / DAOM BR144) TaxID=431595 RepID=K3X5J1_GLOUD
MAISTVGCVSMLLLAVQFGLQPILYKEFASGAKSSSALVIACELCKLAIACLVLVSSGDFVKLVKSWELQQSLRASGLPACTYAVQNVLVQISYQHLPPIVFNLINQTKLLWTALFVFVLLGTKFSRQQCGAMIVLLAAAVLLSLAKESSGSGKGAERAADVSFELGLLPVLVASILSGFGAAITQRSMQIQKRDPALVTVELSVYGSIFLVLPMLWSALSPLSASSDNLEGSLSSWASLWDGCDALTLIPVVTNAFGGLLVGTVTKHVGGVLKSFALICGIAFTAFVESYVYGAVLPLEVYVAAALVAFSLFLYSSYPYKEAAPAKKKTQ